jgi:uncharacterized protein (DUF2461 family)
MKGPATHFHGWTAAALDFYEGLEVDNSRAYWQSHKKVYDDEVRAPMEALLAELCDEFGDAKMLIRIDPGKPGHTRHARPTVL